MKCANCGRLIPDSSDFCPKCGAKTQRQDSGGRKKKKASMGERLIWGVLAAVIGLGVSRAIPGMMENNRKNKETSYQAGSVRENTKQGQFQQRLDQYGIRSSLLEPYTDDNEVSNSYLLYVDDADVSYVKVVDMVRKRGSDMVNTASFSYYYLLGEAGYTDGQSKAFIQSVISAFKENYDSSYTYVDGSYDSRDKVARVTLKYRLLDDKIAQKDLTGKGYLDCTGGISFQVSDREFLDGGYIKR